MIFLDLASLGVVGTLPAVTTMLDFLTGEIKKKKNKMVLTEAKPPNSGCLWEGDQNLCDHSV